MAAQLTVGAPSAAWCFLYIMLGASPYRAKLNQQPVPSVASVAESTVLTNKTGEAYTGNTAGRRGDVPHLSNSASLGVKMQLATVLTCRKPARRSRFGESPEGLPGSKSVACSERSIRNLGDPSTSFGFMRR